MKNKQTELEDRKPDLIITRAMAMAEGALVDVSTPFPDDTRLFKYPVAFTREVYDIIKHGDDSSIGGRVWDICFMANIGSGRERIDKSTILFQVLLPTKAAPNGFAKEYTLKAVCGPNDDGSPCITIMFPDQD
jgi:hypothetical protein